MIKILCKSESGTGTWYEYVNPIHIIKLYYWISGTDGYIKLTLTNKETIIHHCTKENIHNELKRITNFKLT